MRHELEHASQWDHHGQPIYGLYDLVLEVLAHKAAELEGCGGMYVNAIPAEQDANAAASRAPSSGLEHSKRCLHA